MQVLHNSIIIIDDDAISIQLLLLSSSFNERNLFIYAQRSSLFLRYIEGTNLLLVFNDFYIILYASICTYSLCKFYLIEHEHMCNREKERIIARAYTQVVKCVCVCLRFCLIEVVTALQFA